MTSFQVDAEGLQRVGSNLNSLGPTMQKMKNVGQTDNGMIGGSEIQDAIDSFASTWNYGAGLLEKHVQTISENVSTAGANYAKADANIAQKATRIV